MQRVRLPAQVVVASLVSLVALACMRFGFDAKESPATDVGGPAGTAGRAGSNQVALAGTHAASIGQAGVSIGGLGGTGRFTLVGGGATSGASEVTVGGAGGMGTTSTNVVTIGGADAGGTTNSLWGGNAGTRASGGAATGSATLVTSGATSGGTASNISNVMGGNGGANSGSNAIGNAGMTAIGGNTTGSAATTAKGGSNAAGAPTSGGTSGTQIAPVPSCVNPLTCSQTDCCSTLDIPAGSYDRGSSPTYSATINAFTLDKFEVTVGRFRAFIAAYDAWRAALHPSAGEGAHASPSIDGSGWDLAWNPNLPTTAAVFTDASHLAACGARGTWSDTVANATPNPENYPINCINWYEAFAFCIWDGGRLPTEAEWQYVAGGGNEYRTYPWGDTPSSDPLPANYYYNHQTALLEVGSEPLGNGRWGQSDLTGSMAEWIVDWWANDYPSTCDNCVNLVPSAYRCNRGGSFLNTSVSLDVGTRGYATPESRLPFAGVRCARAIR